MCSLHFTFTPYLGYTGYVPYYRFSNMSPQSKPKCDIGVFRMCVMDVHDIPAVIQEPFMPPPSAVTASVEWYYLKAGEPTGENPQQFWNRN